MTVQENNRWEDVFAEIRKTLRKQQYDTWFKRVHFTSPGGEEVLLVVPNRFYADWLAANYRGTVKDAVQRALGFEPHLRFEVDSRGAETCEETAADSEPRRAPSPPRLNKGYRLDAFVVGDCNRLAQLAARSVAECPGAVYNPLFIHSDVGMGKTHLLQAVCHRFMELHPGERIACVGGREFVTELALAREEKSLGRFRAKYRSVSLLALDDMQFLAGRVDAQEEFFHVFNELHSQKRQILVSGDRAPQEIPGLSKEILSRLRWGLVANLENPDVETRLAILRRKADGRRLKVEDDVLEYVASEVDRSVRELEGALVRLAAFASLSREQTGVALAREALAGYGSGSPRAINVPQIQEAVARHFGLARQDLVSKRRSRSVSYPRQIGMYLARRLTNLSLGEIGRLFGGRDHTTVLYACEKMEKRRQQDESLAEALAQVAQVLGGKTGIEV